MLDELHRLTAASLLEQTAELSIERLRSIRTECFDAENDVSLVRRVTQGRLDIIGTEVTRRSIASVPNGDARASGAANNMADVAANDVSSLLFEMPEILSDEQSGSARPGARRSVVAEPGPIAAQLIERLDTIAAPSELSGVSELAAPVLFERFAELQDFEAELSQTRSALHNTIDCFQAEIGKRYRDGSVNVETVWSEE